jgi:hypothetical protein
MPTTRDATLTQPVLIPGQQLSLQVPWERDDRPPPPFVRPVIPPKGNVLDARGALEADVVSGVHLGACQVIRRLTPGSAHHLLALRDTWGQGLVPVVMRKLEVSEIYAAEIEAYADAAGKLAHPNLARVFPCEATDEGVFWVTALVSGATLAEISDACVKAGKSVPVGIALAAVHEAALALAELHAPPGEAHALLCDQSLVVGFDGAARLLDVGLFRALRHQTLWPEVMDRIGPYLAPEQVLRGHLPDPRSDVFSLAALLHAFLSGGRTPAQLSFDHRAERHRQGGYPPPSSLNISLSARVDAVVMKALSPDPLQRYGTAVEFAHALKGAAAELFWRPELRAQFVGQLFGERKRREEVLFAATSHDSKENPMARPAPQPSRTPPWAQHERTGPGRLPPHKVTTSVVKRKRYALGAPTPNVPTRPERAVSFTADADDIPFADSDQVESVWVDDGEEYDDDGALKPKLRPLWLTLLAVSLTWFWQQGVMLDEVAAEIAAVHPERAERVERVLQPAEEPVSAEANPTVHPEPVEGVPQLPEPTWSAPQLIAFSGPTPPYAHPDSVRKAATKTYKHKKKLTAQRDAKARRARR